MIYNTTQKHVAGMLKNTKPADKGVYPDKEWWNFNENGLRCLICNEPLTDEDKNPEGWATFLIYIDGLRKIGGVHPICYLSHHHQMGLNIKHHQEFYDGVKSQWKK